MKQNPATNKNIHCMLTRSNCRMQNTCFFLNSEHNIYAFTYIHIIFLKARSWPPLYTVPLNWFPFFLYFAWWDYLKSCCCNSKQSFPYMKFNMDMLKRWGFAQGASGKHLNEQEALLVRYSRVAGTNCSQTAEGRAMRSPGPRQPQDPPPRSPNLEMQWGYSLKSIF